MIFFFTKKSKSIFFLGGADVGVVGCSYVPGKLN